MGGRRGLCTLCRASARAAVRGVGGRRGGVREGVERAAGGDRWGSLDGERRGLNGMNVRCSRGIGI